MTATDASESAVGEKSSNSVLIDTYSGVSVSSVVVTTLKIKSRFDRGNAFYAFASGINSWHEGFNQSFTISGHNSLSIANWRLPPGFFREGAILWTTLLYTVTTTNDLPQTSAWMLPCFFSKLQVISPCKRSTFCVKAHWFCLVCLLTRSSAIQPASIV